MGQGGQAADGERTLLSTNRTSSLFFRVMVKISKNGFCLFQNSNKTFFCSNFFKKQHSTTKKAPTHCAIRIFPRLSKGDGQLLALREASRGAKALLAL